MSKLDEAIKSEDELILQMMAAPIDNYGLHVLKKKQEILRAAKAWAVLMKKLPDENMIRVQLDEYSSFKLSFEVEQIMYALLEALSQYNGEQ
jgi:hypothetical protein